VRAGAVVKPAPAAAAARRAGAGAHAGARALAQAANGRLERLRRGGAGDAAEQELAAMRKLQRCSVCQERQKDAVITKCWHVFCYQCIDATHTARNRKCPGCGARFGMDDVQRFYYA